MLSTIQFDDKTIVAFKVTGKLHHEDYVNTVIPAIDAALKLSDKISFFLSVEDFDGWDWQAAYDDFKLGVKHRHDFKRAAIVGNKKWEEWLCKVIGIFVEGETKYFDIADAEAARAWIQEKE